MKYLETLSCHKELSHTIEENDPEQTYSVTVSGNILTPSSLWLNPENLQNPFLPPPPPCLTPFTLQTPGSHHYGVWQTHQSPGHCHLLGKKNHRRSAELRDEIQGETLRRESPMGSSLKALRHHHPHTYWLPEYTSISLHLWKENIRGASRRRHGQAVLSDREVSRTATGGPGEDQETGGRMDFPFDLQLWRLGSWT